MGPHEYCQHERQVGCHLTTQLNFRISQLMVNHLREYARLKKADVSLCARAAIFQYLKSQGMDALSALPQSPE